jgi:hypothetical protein
VFVAEGNRITALAPVLRPGAHGADIAATAGDVPIGKKVILVTGVGYDLRASHSKLELVTDRFPYGSNDGVHSARLLADGTAYFTSRPARNTRFRARIAGTRSKPLTVYAYPRYRFDFDAVSPRYAIAKVTVKRAPARRLKGSRAFLYLDRRGGGGTLRRLGRARLMRTARNATRAAVRFRRLDRVGRRDLFVACVKGIERRGYGRRDSLARGCGERRFALRLKSAEPPPTPRVSGRGRRPAVRPRRAP